MDYSTVTRNILIVEDNPGDFILIKEYLGEEFLKPVIEHVKTFTEAKTKLKSVARFDTILLDLSLPDASGELLVNEIVQLAGSTPIIVLTGYTDKEFGIKTLSLGIADYLLKDELTAAQLYKSIAYGAERRRINNELKESEEKYRNLFNLSPLPMWVYDPQTLIFLNVNEAAIEHYGYTKQEFLSMTLKDIRPSDESVKPEEVITDLNYTESLKKEIYRHQKKNGDIIDVEVQCNEIFFREKKAKLVLSNDITVSVYQKNILAFEKEVYELNATAGIKYYYKKYRTANTPVFLFYTTKRR
jgi:PAS domain S-box-containing protein